MMKFQETLQRQEKEASHRKALQIIALFQTLGPDVSFNTGLVFMEIVLKGSATSLSELSEATGLNETVVQRHLSNLSRWNYRKKKGFELISYETDLMDQRRKIVKLTRKGEALSQSIHDALE